MKLEYIFTITKRNRCLYSKKHRWDCFWRKWSKFSFIF